MLILSNKASTSKRITIAAAAAAAALLVSSSPGRAQSNGIADIEAVVTGLGAIAAAAVAIVVVPLGARIAIKFVNRVSAKG